MEIDIRRLTAHIACMMLTELPEPSSALLQTKIVQAVRPVLEIDNGEPPYESPA